ncbi:hypothetical protein RRG08_009225 [Elysia crispata]|uniref:Uncharacterized protein n=1 Tax=Elysia crispata TaxID=231223 RepID=A0AAE1AYI6_9GAST|nr:hypothetical protein RRG08_009225 [Elysia crispata]
MRTFGDYPGHKKRKQHIRACTSNTDCRIRFHLRPDSTDDSIVLTEMSWHSESFTTHNQQYHHLKLSGMEMKVPDVPYRPQYLHNF